MLLVTRRPGEEVVVIDRVTGVPPWSTVRHPSMVSTPDGNLALSFYSPTNSS